MSQQNPYGVAFAVSLVIGGLGTMPTWANDLAIVGGNKPPLSNKEIKPASATYFDQICKDLTDNQREACEETCRSVEATPEFEGGFCGFGSVCQCTDKGNQTP